MDPKMPKVTGKGNGARIVIPCRVSFVHLTEPHASLQGIEPKYQLTCLVQKDDAHTVEIISEALKAAKAQGLVEKWKGKEPKELVNCVQDGDAINEKADTPRPEREGCYSINAKNAKPVTVLRAPSVEKADASIVYSGCYCMVSLTLFPYESAGKKGVAAGLNSVIFIGDGEKLGGSGDGSKDFEGIDFSGVTEAGIGEAESAAAANPLSVL